MKAPFPWFGGKRHVADVVWRAFGDVDHYVEPFAGSLAVLLKRPARHDGWQTGAETVNDADAHLCNLWRAIVHAPEEVARHADWPVNECVPAGTHIAIPGGSIRVEDVRPGMMVYGQRNGEIVATEVLAIRTGSAAEFVALGALRLTGNHPVWTDGGEYVAADHLAPGMTAGVLLAGEGNRPSLGRVCIARSAQRNETLRRRHVAQAPVYGASVEGTQGWPHAPRLLDSWADDAGAEADHGGIGERARNGLAGRRTRLDSDTARGRCTPDESHGRRRWHAGPEANGGATAGAFEAHEGQDVARVAASGHVGLASFTGIQEGDRASRYGATPHQGNAREDGSGGTRARHVGARASVSRDSDGCSADGHTPAQDRTDNDESKTGPMPGDRARLSVDYGRGASVGSDRSLGPPSHTEGLSLQRESLPYPVVVYNFETTTGNYFADGILVHNCDLFARHLWLVREGAQRIARMEADPEFYDAKVAGWWLWGQCAWIGSGWCSGGGPWIVEGEQVVRLEKSVEKGVGKRQRPHLGDAGQGVNRQLPHLGDAGRGLNRKRPHLGSAGQGAVNGSDMIAGGSGAPSATWDRSHWREGEEPLVYGYMRALQARLRRVRVCCGDWSRVVTDGALAHGATVGVFLDPPYDEEVRTRGLYATEGGSLSADVRAWVLDAAEHDPRFRIALCGYEGEHEMPATWGVHKWASSGAYLGGRGGGVNREYRHRERVWFSPSCAAQVRQGNLFGDGAENLLTAPKEPR